MSQELGMDEALDIAMEAELQAQAFYAQAAAQVQDPNGRDLLGRLAAFENYHYQKLAELAQALKEDGAFIEYEARTVEQFSPLVGRGEAGGTHLQELHDVVSILSKAIENEKVARAQYQALAETTSDDLGQAMFRDLANEETIHQRILEDEFFSLSNQGVWGWSGMYGE
jgi:rubrerythrin